jgi:hypothetical protein
MDTLAAMKAAVTVRYGPPEVVHVMDAPSAHRRRTSDFVNAWVDTWHAAIVACTAG